MRFKEFEKAAREAFQEIPESYKAGIEGLVVSREAPLHPTLPDVFTLGECITEDYASDWGGPETTLSKVVLYWGSFQSLSGRESDFDWEGELWETLTHELRHHLESLAREDTLEGVDYALDETFKRDEGLDFDPWYFQHGDALGGGLFQVEANAYLEQSWREEAFKGVDWLDFQYKGGQFRIPRPAELGDVHYIWIQGLQTEGGTLELVLVRKRSWWDDAKRLFGTYRPVVLESVAVAEPWPTEG